MNQTTQKTTLLPQTNWKKVLTYIKNAGENRAISRHDLGGDYSFWEELGVFVSGIQSGQLTNTGRAIFESLYIRRDGNEKEMLKHLLLAFPPTIAIQQYLWGIVADVEQVLTVLKTTGFWYYDSREPLTHFLDFLNYTEIVNYNKKTRAVKVLVSPDTPRAPRNIFIDPSRPFSNIMWIKRILSECESGIFWLDKNFQKEGLEWLWAIADAGKITEIRVLSLDMGDINLSTDTRKYYRRFKQEMANKSITVVWATIDSKLIRDTHDRWILDGVGLVRNIPNVNAISSGQRSELNATDNYDKTREAFNRYWSQSTEVI